MAFNLQASTAVTQVVFFKFKSKEACLEHFSSRITINEDILLHFAEEIEEKVTKHVEEYVRMLDI